MTDLTLKIYFRNAACASQRVRDMEKAISERVIELSGGVDRAKADFDEPHRQQNPVSRFNRNFQSAVYEVMDAFDYSPTAQKEAKFSALWLGPDNKVV